MIDSSCVQVLFNSVSLEWEPVLTPGLRKFTFTTHVTSSVGWTGAVIVFLALAVIGLISTDERTVRGAYLVMAPAAWFVLVPLAHASLVSGVALSLGTSWGLFRYNWVVLKLLITLFSTVILLMYMDTFRRMAALAADPVVALGLVRNPSPVVHAGVALLLLLLATVLGIYKPFGMTAWQTPIGTDTPKPRPQQSGGSATNTSSWVYVAWFVLIVAAVLVIALHLVSRGLERH